VGDSTRNEAPDRELFGDDRLPALRAAVDELSWLLGRGYSFRAALELVGDRHQLVARQRVAVGRAAASDASAELRLGRALPLPPAVDALAIDGYNLLATVESALTGNVVIVGRDGGYRDLRALSGRFGSPQNLAPALALVAELLDAWAIARVEWLLDRPVSRSAELGRFIAVTLAQRRCAHAVRLCHDPDAELIAGDLAVVSSDARVLDGAARSVPVAAAVIARFVPEAWLVRLG
jgi:hypothetical protein